MYKIKLILRGILEIDNHSSFGALEGNKTLEDINQKRKKSLLSTNIIGNHLFFKKKSLIILGK